MILQALADYYQRRQAAPDPASRLPSFGLESKEVPFILEIDESGALRGVIDTRRKEGNKLLATPYLLPSGVKKTSGVAANLLWDNAEYVLGLADPKKLEAATAKGKAEDYLARLQEMHAAFCSRIRGLPAAAQADAGMAAVLAFLQSEPCEQVARLPVGAEIAASNPVLTFRLVGDTQLVSQRPGVAPFAIGTDEPDDAEVCTGLCLVTGQDAPIERLHTAIKGVWGAQTSGANIVSFNLDAFNSYGKSRGSNAPVSRAAAFAYTTALNALLARGSRQRVQVGDASTVFWAQTPDPIEDWLAELISGDDPDVQTQQVKALFESVRSGAFDGARGDKRFYVLGLAPNAARIAVRFWHDAPLRDIAAHVTAWFDDLRMARGPNDPEHPSLFRLLTAVALQGKADNVPPRLGGDIVRAIFTGTPYPALWLNAAVQRCRAERQVNHLRAAAIRACLRRSAGNDPTSPGETPAMLDIHNPSPAYRLGRLFATLEKIQEEASSGSLNTTIRERYYGAASSTPAAVFTTLLRLKNHHLAKLGGGRAAHFEKLIGEIASGLGDFPGHLSLQDQGRFAIGYYHQRQDFFTAKREASTAEPKATTTAAMPGGN
jgi:CRISPR-associated protein Csd1